MKNMPLPGNRLTKLPFNTEMGPRIILKSRNF